MKILRQENKEKKEKKQFEELQGGTVRQEGSGADETEHCSFRLFFSPKGNNEFAFSNNIQNST